MYIGAKIEIKVRKLGLELSELLFAGDALRDFVCVRIWLVRAIPLALLTSDERSHVHLWITTQCAGPEA